LTEWRHRCVEKLHPRSDEEDIELFRLIDQYPIYSVDRISNELKQISSSLLGVNRSAVTSLVNRMALLSNGIGLMGGLKLERSGSERGMFRLMDHGFLPFSAALSALALIKESGAVSNCERIHDLLIRGELDVELAENMLKTWHNLHALRLWQEQSFHIDGHAYSTHTTFLNPGDLSAEQLLSLKEALESVAKMQRHVEILSSGREE
jgi:signal-transduction protein with cAMP-binding, CBS, and nucleotidyltransferase domain